MIVLQDRKRWTKLLNSPFVAILLLAVVIILGRGVYGVYKKDSLARINANEARGRLDELEARKSALDAEVKRLSTDRGVEEELRKKFQVVKPGENMVIIVDRNTAKSPEVVKEESWLANIWSGFKNLIGIKN